MPPATTTTDSRLKRFSQKFLVLASAPRELWIIYAAYILENLAYKVGAAGVLTLWLSSDLGFNDVEAGAMIAVWSAIMTLITVMIGSLTDALGIRRTFLLGFVICLISRCVMTVTVEKWVVLPFGLYLQALGLALMIPVMIAGVKKYTNAAQRSVAFSLYYALMNLGFAIGDGLFDRVRGANGLGEHGHWVLPGLGLELSTYRVLILISVIFTVPGLLLVWGFLREGVEMTENGVRILPPNPPAVSQPNLATRFFHKTRSIYNGFLRVIPVVWQRHWYRYLVGVTLLVTAVACGIAFKTHGFSEIFLIPFKCITSVPIWLVRAVGLIWTVFVIGTGLLVLSCVAILVREVIVQTSETGAKTAHLFEGLWVQRPFYRFLVFMTLVVGVRMIFYQLAYTFPKFGIRELGNGAPIAQISSMLNSILIVVLVPICGVLTQKITAYRMVTVGSFISALSVFFLAVPREWFRPLADGWLGHFIGHTWLGVEGAVNPLYISIFLFIVLLSVGEALWSPRLYEYAAAIAPKGQEASYMALSLLPYFLAKFFVGGSSGWLLARFCPADGPRHPETMWLLIGCMALITPLGTFIFRKYIQVHEDGR